VGPVPIGDDIWEVGRGCFSPDLSAQEFERVSSRVSAAMMECAVLHGITTLTTFAPVQALSRALAWGWDLTPLGPPRDCGSGLLGAFSMPVNADVVRRFREKIGLTSPVVQLDMHRAA
jgi:N-acyl-L-homoserine lactone synthetase